MQKLPIFQGGGFITSIELHCFDLEGAEEGMTLCSRDPLHIAEFRQKLIIATIKSYFRAKGIVNVNVLMPQEDNSETWVWRDQSRWSSLCSSGKYQSPIDLSVGMSRDVQWMSLSFGFKTATNARARFNGHESIVTGDFGFLSHKLEIGVRKFLISKISFKFPSEHSIMGVDTKGEIQVYMSSKDVLIIN